jgi:hypothetical protein
MALSNLPRTREPQAIHIGEGRNGKGRVEYHVDVRPETRATAKHSKQLRSLSKARRYARKVSEATGLIVIDMLG